uniref:Uncharacterized protein n=1 Tax=Pristionchus pacificus TaxID=54126 RepID=A0A2A6B839_PRIPA|eukprot:PDM62027.1 hypothetical protein PRIPAC_51469 [Pristionchus pacificus]
MLMTIDQLFTDSSSQEDSPDDSLPSLDSLERRELLRIDSINSRSPFNSAMNDQWKSVITHIWNSGLSAVQMLSDVINLQMN